MIYWQRSVAVMCVVLLLAPVSVAQSPGLQTTGGGGGFFFRDYKYRELPAVDLSNSSRLEALLRAGNIYLSLQDAIALALENNLDIAYQRYGTENARANLLRAEAGGLLRGVTSSVQSSTTSALSQAGITSVAGASAGSLSLSTGSASGTIVTATGSTIPTYDPSFWVSYAAQHRSSPQANTVTTGTTAVVLNSRGMNMGYSQGFATGTTFSASFNSSRVDSNNLRNALNPNNSAYVSATVTQHLLQGFGLAVNRRNIRIAKNNIRVNDLAFRQQVISTVSQVIQGYWDLVTYTENVKVAEQSLSLSEKLYNDNKKQVEIGTLAPISIVQAEAEVARNQQSLVQARTQLLQQETSLKNALSRTGVASPTIAEAHIIPTDRIRVSEQEKIEPIQDLVARALESRPELAQSRINVDNLKLGLLGTKEEMRPSLDVQASFQNNGLAGMYGPEPGADAYFIGGAGSAMSQVFRRNFPDYFIGVQLTIPLRNRSARADMVMDQISLRQQEITQQRLVNSIRADVRNALIAVQQAKASYDAAVKARMLAEQTLDAEQKKYALGASTIYYVIQYQRDLAEARSNEVAAESQYAKARVVLDQATGRTLDANNISIDEAVKGRVARAPSPVVPTNN